ncbi:MAG: HAMP domain-containing histidine kinase [Clostridiales bacterium]|nr:HAMP domain-containing histidine kinase [Clostridiales bacterium]
MKTQAKGGVRPLWKAYLGQRWPALLILAAATAIFALVLALHQVPTAPALYAGEICLVLLLFLGIWDLARVRKKHRDLAGLQSALPASLQHLPPPGGTLEGDYQDLLRQLARLHQEAAGREQERYQRLQAYTASFSHQIKTPIAASRLLLGHVDSPRRAPLLDELYKIERQVDMALNFFKLDARMDDYLFAPHRLKDIAAAAARRHARLFVLKQLSLQVAIPDDIQVTTDDKQLGFVLDQLLSNAIKYTAAGGIRIHWDGAAGCLQVTDSGMGIPKQDLPRITEQGYTGENGHLDPRATGMGLYLARAACERMDIGLHFMSAPGAGTTATLAFGRQQPPRD